MNNLQMLDSFVTEVQISDHCSLPEMDKL